MAKVRRTAAETNRASIRSTSKWTADYAETARISIENGANVLVAGSFFIRKITYKPSASCAANKLSSSEARDLTVAVLSTQADDRHAMSPRRLMIEWPRIVGEIPSLRCG